MSGLRDKIESMLDGGEVSLPLVNDMMEKYPFFTLPAVILLRDRWGSLTEDERMGLVNRVALNLPDRSMLQSLIKIDGIDGYVRFYPEDPVPERVSTDDAIDTFLDNYGNIAPEEEKLLTRMIFNPVPDYASMLAEEEKQSLPETAEVNGNSQDALLNAFILKSRQEGGMQPDEEETADVTAVAADGEPLRQPQSESLQEDALLSESLAKIYIKQHRYERAYEIISRLNLNYPEKSVYFADQLRFLRKLIINSQHNRQKIN